MANIHNERPVSNPAKPARLWLNKPRGLWYILDDENGKRRQIPTGCRADDRETADGRTAAGEAGAGSVRVVAVHKFMRG